MVDSTIDSPKTVDSLKAAFARASSSKPERRWNRAKRKARSELKTPEAWFQYKYGERDDLCNVQELMKKDTSSRIDMDKVSEKKFKELSEEKNLPAVLTGGLEEWDLPFWTIENFERDLGEVKFKCGEDDEGYSVKLKFKYFLEYMQKQKTIEDDSPLYIFDGNIGDHLDKRELLKHYTIPKYFREDYFKYAGEKNRPPHRWLVLGPGRSGSNIHIDPLGTSAWNTLISGYKRWVLFPPTTPKEIVKPDLGQTSEAISWFDIVYPTTQNSTWPYAKPIEIIQGPGETMFVPSGWWHIVLNLTQTVAVTQNFVSSTNLPIVWKKLLRDRPKFSQYWLRMVEKKDPTLKHLINDINSKENTAGADFQSDSSSDSSSSSSFSESEDEEGENGNFPSNHVSSKKSKSCCQCNECIRKCAICYAKRQADEELKTKNGGRDQPKIKKKLSKRSKKPSTNDRSSDDDGDYDDNSDRDNRSNSSRSRSNSKKRSSKKKSKKRSYGSDSDSPYKEKRERESDKKSSRKSSNKERKSSSKRR